MEKRQRLDRPITTTGDEHHTIYASTNCVAVLDKDIRRFETDHEVPKGLSDYISSSEEVQVIWYEKLLEEWTKPDAPPYTPEEATELFHDILHRINPYYLVISDLEGFLHYYGLPQYEDCLLSKRTLSGESSQEEDAMTLFTRLGKGLKIVEDRPEFLFN